MSSLVIFLHGVGSRGADLAPLGDAWRGTLPDTTFAAPDAPLPFDQGGTGRQWFSVRGVTEANRPHRVADAREAFDRILRDIVEARGFTDRLDRIALVGFSQGSIMALDALASGRWPVAAIVAFSGRLASPEPFTPSLATPLLLVHGDADPVMPARESAEADVRLTREGVTVERHILPRLGHAISPEGAELAARFLASQLPANA